TASARPIDSGLSRLGPGVDHRRLGPQQSDPPRANPGFGASCCTFFRAEIAVELAKQSIAILFGPVGQMRDEVLNLVAGGFAQGLHAAEIGGIGLDQGGIELVLTNQLAETVANRATAVVPVAIGRLRQLFGLWTRSGLT